MEISFISEVGKKNVPETSSITNLEGKCALRQQYTARSKDSAHRDRTVVFVGTNNDGTFLSCATQRHAAKVSVLK